MPSFGSWRASRGPGSLKRCPELRPLHERLRRAVLEVAEDVGELGGRQGKAGVSAPVVHPDHAGRFIENPAAGEDDAVDVAIPRLVVLGSEELLVGAPQDLAGIRLASLLNQSF